MDDTKQKILEYFWLEVLHRAQMLLSDMNIGSFYQWSESVGNKEIHRLLKLIELLLWPDKNTQEVIFLTGIINYKFNAEQLFSCFKISGITIIREGMKGDIYYMPVLYVLIRYQVDNAEMVHPSNFECCQAAHLDKIFTLNSDKNLHKETHQNENLFWGEVRKTYYMKNKEPCQKKPKQSNHERSVIPESVSQYTRQPLYIIIALWCQQQSRWINHNDIAPLFQSLSEELLSSFHT